MFDRRSAEEKAARFAAMPLGQAVAAKERGDGFLQVQIPISTLEGRSSFGETTNRLVFTGEGTAQRGLLVGIYLFRDVPSVLPREVRPNEVPPCCRSRISPQQPDDARRCRE